MVCRRRSLSGVPLAAAIASAVRPSGVDTVAHSSRAFARPASPPASARTPLTIQRMKTREEDLRVRNGQAIWDAQRRSPHGIGIGAERRGASAPSHLQTSRGDNRSRRPNARSSSRWRAGSRSRSRRATPEATLDSCKRFVNAIVRQAPAPPISPPAPAPLPSSSHCSCHAIGVGHPLRLDKPNNRVPTSALCRLSTRNAQHVHERACAPAGENGRMGTLTCNEPQRVDQQ